MLTPRLDFNNTQPQPEKPTNSVDLTPDPKAIAAYFDLVFGYCDGMIPFRGLTDLGQGLANLFHHVWIEADQQVAAKALTFAQWAANNGAAFYVIPGTVAQRGQAKASDVVQLQTVLVDLDAGDVEAKLEHLSNYLGEPTAVVESGGITLEGQSKLHVYWKLSEPAEKEDITIACRLRHEIAIKVGGDPHFRSAHQPIRVAGSVYHKHGHKRLVVFRSFTSQKFHLPFLAEAVSDMPSMEGIDVSKLDFNTASMAKPSVAAILTTPVRAEAQDAWSRFDGASAAIGHYIRMAHEGRMKRDDAWEAIRQYNAAMLRPPWSEDRLANESERLWKKHCENNGPAIGAQQGDHDWPEPLPLSNTMETPQPYPLDALPEVLRNAAREVARFVKVPVASPAVIGLSVAALAIGKKARIQERPGLYHHSALFLALIAASGERKSPPFKLMTLPLEHWIEGELDDYHRRVAEASTTNQVLDALIASLKKQASSAKYSEQAQQEFVRRMAEEECKRIPVPPHPRMFTSDATEERLFQRMHLRGGEYAVLSGEGRPVFDAIMGKYSGKDRTGDAIYLTGISGDTITRDRVGNENGPEDRMIVNPCLNVCVMVQPDKYLEAARHPTLRESGALARIWPVWLPSLVGTRMEEVNEPGLNEFLLQPYEETIQGLLNARVTEEKDKSACHLVRLSPEARESRRQWHNAVELQMAEGRDLEDVRDIASKAVSATVKAALVLHLLERPSLLMEEESELDLSTWERAKLLGEYHLAEAIRVQRLAGDALESAALRVARWAMESGTMEFSVRTLCKFGPRPRMQTKEAESIMGFMIEMNWAKKLPPSPGER
ncbi:MAG: DUF3987 domain-containing protein, partial [Magnetococcales bacterium]|nr:DUF3987 domain-containing protein [Magnetococcales bacterium]